MTKRFFIFKNRKNYLENRFYRARRCIEICLKIGLQVRGANQGLPGLLPQMPSPCTAGLQAAALAEASALAGESGS